MARSILEEAVEDVQSLKRAAEENAKNLLVEAMSPRIKDFIQSHLGQEGVEGGVPGPDGAPAGNNDTAYTPVDAGEDTPTPAGDDDVYEIEDDETDDQDQDEDEDDTDVEFEDDDEGDDEEVEFEDDEDEDDEDQLPQKPKRKAPPVEEGSDDDSDDADDDEDEDDMDETLEITSEDLKKAFISSIQSGLKNEDSTQGRFHDPQDPNDSEFGLVHKVPGETMWADGGKVLKKSKHAKMMTKEQHEKVVQKLHRQLAQYHEAFKYLKKNLNEMNLFNAKLIYTTRLLQNNLSNKQKLQVVEKLDKARSKREVEFMYNTLSESFKIAGVLGEGRAKVKGPKASRVMKPGSTLNEGKTRESTQSNRWAELAGLTD